MVSELAGKKVQLESLIDVEKLTKAFYEIVPSSDNQLISFGTSGHRGKSLEGSFNDLHVSAITQAICDGREQFGATGVCYVGQDTHALSQPAFQTVLEVLAGNNVIAGIDCEGDFVPTPSMSRTILRENEKEEKKVDGIIITPSHNPPDNGGIKYNPTHGGPAEQEITNWIQNRANEYVRAKGNGIKRIKFDEIPKTLQVRYPYKTKYVAELTSVVDIESIQEANLHVLVDALGGSGGKYWEAIRDTYNLDLTVIHSEYDPQFSFMRYDHDGEIRMDCSSNYAMAGVIESIGDYDLAVGNDPDYDRYGIVTKDGMMSANAFLVTAGSYLFMTRPWENKGMAKSIVVTDLLTRVGQAGRIPVFETPVGFKYFAPMLYAGQVGIAGEESAGGSFLTKDGKVWTTDKDGIIMALLAMEIMAVTGRSPQASYEEITKRFGKSYFGRYEAKCSAKEKALLKKMDISQVKAGELNGEKIIDIRTKAHYRSEPIGGLFIRTTNGWLVARPSGTEDLYKIYGESFVSETHLKGLLEEGQKFVSQALKGA